MMASHILHQRLSKKADNSRLYAWIQILGASFLIAFAAQIEILLPFTPVPLTCQTLGVLFVGALLGSRKGALSVLLYLAEGAAGLPVLSGGSFGILQFVGPTGGYLAGFVAQAYIVGWFSEKEEQFQILKALAAVLLACAVQMACGLLWLSVYVGWNHLLALGLYPFIPGELLKALLVTAYLKWFR